MEPPRRAANTCPERGAQQYRARDAAPCLPRNSTLHGASISTLGEACQPKVPAAASCCYRPRCLLVLVLEQAVVAPGEGLVADCAGERGSGPGSGFAREIWPGSSLRERCGQGAVCMRGMARDRFAREMVASSPRHRHQPHLTPAPTAVPATHCAGTGSRAPPRRGARGGTGPRQPWLQSRMQGGGRSSTGCSPADRGRGGHCHTTPAPCPPLAHNPPTNCSRQALPKEPAAGPSPNTSQAGRMPLTNANRDGDVGDDPPLVHLLRDGPRDAGCGTARLGLHQRRLPGPNPSPKSFEHDMGPTLTSSSTLTPLEKRRAC